MNVTVWGPIVWNFLADVCYRNDRVSDSRIEEYTILFFKSLAFILPCKYCRQSYRQYFREIDLEDAVKQKSLLAWLWSLHEMVNNKLQKPESCRIPYCVFARRMNCYTHAGSAEHLFDLLGILGLNYESDDRLKKKYMLIFCSVLPVVIPYVQFSAILHRQPLQLQDLSTQSLYLNWLYSLRQAYNKKIGLPSLPPQQKLWKKYENAKAGMGTTIIMCDLLP